MAERSDELTEESLEDREAQAAIEDAQSLVDDLEGVGDLDSGGSSGFGGLGGEDRERTQSTTEESSGGVLSRVIPSFSVPSLSNLFSSEYFLFALIVVVASYFVGGMVVPFVDRLGGLVGVFVATFLMGVASGRRRYLEVSLASVLAGAAVGFLGNLTLALVTGAGTTLAMFSAVLFLLVALVGTYFGRDLRAGLGGDGPGPGDEFGDPGGPGGL